MHFCQSLTLNLYIINEIKKLRYYNIRVDITHRDIIFLFKVHNIYSSIYWLELVYVDEPRKMFKITRKFDFGVFSLYFYWEHFFYSCCLRALCRSFFLLLCFLFAESPSLVSRLESIRSLTLSLLLFSSFYP